jgi:hypothetical protein
MTPLYFDDPAGLGQTIREGVASGTIQNLFIVLRLPTVNPFPGIHAQPPGVGVSITAPLFGLSYTSGNGIDFNPLTGLDIRFSLLLAQPVPEPGS